MIQKGVWLGRRWRSWVSRILHLFLSVHFAIYSPVKWFSFYCSHTWLLAGGGEMYEYYLKRARLDGCWVA